MNLHRVTAVAAAAVLGGVLLVTAATPAGSQSDPATITRGAGVRATNGVWRALDDGAHANTLVASIKVLYNGDIKVNFLPGGGRVVWGTAGDDETVARLRIDCGPSMAPDYMIIRCWDQVTGKLVRGDSPRLSGTMTNLWLATVQEEAL